MKKVEVREWDDLTKEEQEKALALEVEFLVERDLDMLGHLLEVGEITDKDYYEELGCSKFYAESTSWFIPACYYEKNKEEIDLEAQANVKRYFYDKSGCEVCL